MKGKFTPQKRFEELKASETWKNVPQTEIDQIQLNIDSQVYFIGDIKGFIFLAFIILYLMLRFMV